MKIDSEICEYSAMTLIFGGAGVAILLTLFHTCFTKRQYFSTLFLCLMFLYSIYRSLYFIHKRFFVHMHCPDLVSLSNSQDTMKMTIFGVLPEGFFLSMVSTTIHHVIHLVSLVLPVQISAKHRLFAKLQHIVNIASYLLFFMMCFLGNNDYEKDFYYTYIGIIIVAEIINGGYFFICSYSIKSYVSRTNQHSDIFTKSLTNTLLYASFFTFIGFILKAQFQLLGDANNTNPIVWFILFFTGQFIPEVSLSVVHYVTLKQIYSFHRINYARSISRFPLLDERLDTITEEPSFFGRLLSGSHFSIGVDRSRTSHGTLSRGGTISSTIGNGIIMENQSIGLSMDEDSKRINFSAVQKL